MKNRHFFLTNEKGQVLPLVVIMLFAMLAMVVVLLDGGFLMYNRRVAQVSADAGALAGARQLCQNNPTTAVQAANTYAYLNQATSVNPTVSGGVITVNTAVQNASFFAKIFGVQTLNSTAVAYAACFYPSQAKRILPIAFDCSTPPVGQESNWENRDCKMKTWDYTTLMAKLKTNDPQPYANIYIVMDTAKVCDNYTGTIICEDMVGGVGGNTGWLNLTGDSNGENNLISWITSGLGPTDDPLKIHTWLSGIPGAKTPNYSAVDKLGLPHLVLVPMYDKFCESDNPLYVCPNLVDSMDDFNHIKKGATVTFHIAGFADFVVTCTSQTDNGKKCPGFNSIPAADQNKVKNFIEGYFVTGAPMDPDTTGTTGINAGAYIVSLTDKK